MVKLIKSIVHKEAENKARQYSGAASLPNYISSDWGTHNILPVTPYSGFMAISQGTGQGDRIGNRIRVRKAFVKLVFYPRAYDVYNPQPKPQDVRLLIVKSKDDKNTLPGKSSFGDFFQSNNSYNAPTGNLPDMVRSVNKDSWVVYKDIHFKLGCSAYFSDGAGNANDASQQFYNNDYKYNKIMTIDVTRFIPKTIVYQDNNTNPISDLVNLVILPMNADGTDANALSAGDFPSYFYFQTELIFEDA